MTGSYDWILILLVVVLTAIGFAAIYSIDLSKGTTLTYLPTQATSFFIGLVLLFVMSRIHSSVFFASAKWWYVASLLLLILVLFFGSNVHGTTGWFRFGGLSFQPVEFVKISLIIWLAYLISRQGRKFERWQFWASTGFFTFLAVGLIMLQPDLGSSLVLLAIWFFLIVIAGAKKLHILFITIFLTVGFLIGWNFLFKDYQKDRFISFLDPSADPLGSGYNIIQSMIAIGSGKIFGRGLGFGSQSQLHFLPEAQTDFIFAVVAEELGFVGVVIVLALFFLLIARLIYLANRCKDDFSAYIILGASLLILIQILINIGGAMSILPVTGVTLPFLSYGGSSLLINFLLIGLVQSVIRSFGLNSNLEKE